MAWLAVAALLAVGGGIASARTEIARVPRFRGPLVVADGRVFWVQRLPLPVSEEADAWDGGLVVRSAAATGGVITDVLTVPPTPHPGYNEALQFPVLKASGDRVALDVYSEGVSDLKNDDRDTSISDDLWTASLGSGTTTLLVRCSPTTSTGNDGADARRLTGLSGDEVAYYDGCGAGTPDVVRSFAPDGSSVTQAFDTLGGRVDDLQLAGQFAAWQETAPDGSTALVVHDRASGADAYRLAGATGALGLQPDGKVLFATPSGLAWASVQDPNGHLTGLDPPLGFAGDAILAEAYPGASDELGLFELSTGDVRQIATGTAIFTAAFDGNEVAWAQEAPECDQTSIYVQAVTDPPFQDSRPADCPPQHFTILTYQLVLEASGRVRVRVLCGASLGPCAGTLRIERRSGQVLARTRMHLEAGATAILSIPLVGFATHLIRHRRHLNVYIAASLDDPHAVRYRSPAIVVAT